MSERRKVLSVSLIIMTCVALVVGAVVLVLLYRVSFDEQRERLVETAQSWARLIEAVARFDATYSAAHVPGGAEAATLSQIIQAHEQFRGFGETGEFTLARREKDEIVFLLRHRHADLDNPQPVAFTSELAEPMRRALSGESGTVVGLDYRGERVLAAYEPIEVVDWGVVCKIDLAEIRSAFVRAGALALTLGALVIVVGAVMLIHSTNPLIERIESSKAFLQRVIDGIPESILVIDRDRRVVLGNETARQVTGLPEAIPDETRCFAVSHGRTVPCEGPDCPCSLEAVMATNAPVTVTHTHVDHDGNELIVEMIAAPIFDGNGEVVQIVESCRDISERKADERKLKEAFAEITQLKDRLEAENIALREEIRVEHGHPEIVGNSAAIKAVLGKAEQVGPTDSTVLITGETGTGKELMARAIHALSPRKRRAMVHVNCAALPATLIESELFGREKGAYTGALSLQVGRFELADQSTIFLDEISALDLDSQGKLLRVLQEGQFERLGSSRTTTVDVRVIAATNRDLAADVSEGRFREDLFYRLDVFPISVPPLRERLEDIPQLLWAFVAEFARAMGKSIEAIPEASIDGLRRYHWPGNVRELKNVVERAMIANTKPTLYIPVPAAVGLPGRTDMTLEHLEREHIETVLQMTGWRVRGTSGAAEVLGLRPTTLESRMAKLGITKPGSNSDIS